MKQILQSLKTGDVTVSEVPCPAVQPGHVLIRSTRTLVSAGTERMLVEFGKAGWIEKARQQPEKLNLVVDKIKTDGVLPTVESVLNKLDQPLPLGYSNTGIVIEVGAGVTSVAVGDRVVSNGKHAEVVSVPANLCAKVPPGVSADEAAFTVIAAIGLQGIRLVQPTLGENVVVTGLGLIGLLTVQLLRAHGCRVLGIDFDPGRLELARQFGAEVVNLSGGEDPLTAAHGFSRGRGVDAVLITASTKSSEPLHQAAVMCRKRGRIVLVGVAGMELSRADFYEKELTFQVSCSYGPGRYDPQYEERGMDYPVGFVRWTEQRNFEAILDMIAHKRLAMAPLISHRFRIEEADAAYDLLGGAAPSLGVLLDYPAADEKPEAELRRSTVKLRAPAPTRRETASRPGSASVAFVGSGNYATSKLIPAFKQAGAELKTIASRSGATGLHAARKFGFVETTTDVNNVFGDPAIASVVIATRHDSHASFACQALGAGKNVFVEKPLALTLEELADIEETYLSAQRGTNHPVLMVGFNRRFAPHSMKMRHLLQGVREPKAVIMTVNAGAIPAGHWTHDPVVGGGRIIGEACHFVDLFRFLVNSPIRDVQARSVGVGEGKMLTGDNASLTFKCDDGSLGTLVYLANGHKSFPKERIEVFVSGRVLQLDNFRTLTGYGWSGFEKMRLWHQDKGQGACAKAFLDAVKVGGPAPIPFEEIIEVSRVTIEAAEALR